MQEKHTNSTPGHAPRATGEDDFTSKRTDPKFARESFTMRRMQTWQIVALAVVAVLVGALVVFYI